MGGEKGGVILHLDLRITRGDVAADRDELSREVGRLLLLTLEMQIHLLAVAGEELRQAEFGLVAQALRGGLYLGLLEFDMADEFGGVILGVKVSTVAA